MPQEKPKDRPRLPEALVGRLYEHIASELRTQSMDAGVWDRVHAEAMGDDAEARALYIRRRFDTLLNEEGVTANADTQENDQIANPAMGTAAPAGTESKPPYHGVGGWLAFLIAQLVVLSPIYLVLSSVMEISRAEHAAPILLLDPQWAAFKTAHWWIFGITASIGIVGGLKLMTDFNRRSVRLAIAALWVGGPGRGLANLIASAVILNFGAIHTADMAADMVAQAICAVIWTAYLLRSKRVRNTYVDGLAKGQAVDGQRSVMTSYLIGVALLTIVLGSVIFFAI